MMSKTCTIQKCQMNVHLIFMKEDQILMLRRMNTGFKDGMYSLPAGKVDMGETIWEAFQREAKEEVGIQIEMSKEVCMGATNILHRYSSQGTIAIDFFLLLTHFQGTPQNMEPNKCDDLSWLPVHALPENVIPYIKKGIANALQKKIFDEHIWE